MSFRNSNSLRERAERLLEQRGVIDSSLYTKDLEFLIQELSVYQIELEHQNQEIQRREQELNHVKERLYDLVDTAPVSYILIQNDYKISDINLTGCSLFYEEKIDIVGKSIVKYILSDFQDIFYLHFQHTLSSTSAKSCDIKMKTVRGNVFYARLISVKDSLSEQDIAVVRTIIIDISTEKEYENKLRKEKENALENAEKLKYITENMEEVFWLCSADSTKLLYINPAFEKIWGLSVSAVLSSPQKVFDFVHPNDKETVLKQFNDYLKADTFETEFRILHSDGAVRWIWVRTFSIKDEQGQVIRKTGIASDVTYQKNREEELKRAKNIEESANKAKSEFLANMSHEIRTPLNGIIGFTDLINDTRLTDEQQEYLQAVKISAKSLMGIIEDILDFSKIEAGRLEIEEIRTDIIDICEEAFDVIKYNASKKALELILDIQSDLPRYVIIDPLRLKQVLVNLLGNAVKFTPSGEIILRVRCEMEVEGAHKKARFYFNVIDTGIGIACNQQQKLFKAFSQADTSTTRKFGGTGLGLAISNSLVEKMGGNLHFYSELGKGSEFFFSVVKSYEPHIPRDLSLLRSLKHILLVEDHKNQALVLEDLLKSWGLKISIKSSKDFEIDNFNFAGEKYDAAIIDYDLNSFKGTDLIVQIRKSQKLAIKNLPVILLNTINDEHYLRMSYNKLKINCHLIKPIKTEELYAALCQLREQKENDVDPNDLMDGNFHLTNFELSFRPIILIAEDNLINIKLVKVFLLKILPNAEVILAKDGEEAVEMYKKFKPDLVLMDIQMPKKSGYVATHEIREYELELGRNVPILALSAGVFANEKEKCIQYGMNDFLSKPIDVKLFKIMLENYLKY